MKTLITRVTTQGQTSVPAEIRRKLGIGPGSSLQWDEEAGNVVVRRAGRYASEDVHRALFPEGRPRPRSLDELEEGLRRSVRARHARR